MTFLTQVHSKPCRTVFRPFMTVFDRLFGADRPRNCRRIKHSSVFRPLAHRFKTAKSVKTAPHPIWGGAANRPRLTLLYPTSAHSSPPPPAPPPTHPPTSRT